MPPRPPQSDARDRYHRLGFAIPFTVAAVLSPVQVRVAALAGIAAAVAVEAGWVVTEVGRQPWIVYGVMRTAEAVNPAPGLATGLALVAAVYVMLTVATVVVLGRMARHRDEPVAPQEGVPEPVDSGR
ncbi:MULTISPECIES: cytochrome ubiquinol oxidase subunit I [unclassified Micromonospora]|uniref:cytochrome ubiquinol oxidase subunit I n=1 Tax=unclassified Micromonospora TaxID=2617518 RepID=UPI00332D8790